MLVKKKNFAHDFLCKWAGFLVLNNAALKRTKKSRMH